MANTKVAEKTAPIEVRLETVRYGGWEELEIAIEVADPKNAYVTGPTLEAILNYRENSVREKITSKSLKVFAGEGRTVGKISGVIVNKAKLKGAARKVTLYSLDALQLLAAWEASVNQNLEIAQLLSIGFCDSLRSIALSQLGIVLDTDERIAWMKSRMEGIEKRNSFTDAIKKWFDEHPEASENARKFIYVNVSDMLNRALTGHPAKYWKEKLNCESDQLRDHWNDRHLSNINALERHAEILVKRGAEPKEAMAEAIAFHQIPINPNPQADSV